MHVLLNYKGGVCTTPDDILITINHELFSPPQLVINSDNILSNLRINPVSISNVIYGTYTNKNSNNSVGIITGAVYIYQLMDNMYYQQILTLYENSHSSNSLFGHSVKIFENLLLVTAPAVNNETGDTYIYNYSTSWSFSHILPRTLFGINIFFLRRTNK